MKISVSFIPTGTWVMEGTSFYCTHEDLSLFFYDEDYETMGGHQVQQNAGYACSYCGEPVEYDLPGDIDDYIAEAEAEAQLMELLSGV